MELSYNDDRMLKGLKQLQDKVDDMTYQKKQKEK